MNPLEGPHVSVRSTDGLVSITVDRVTADYLRYAIAVLGEHVAAGMKVPPMSADMATRLGNLMNEVEEYLRAH
ncbi:hypothetical protein ACWT_2711 [Actinoplanes sp. SE50]|uniref:hypothetical protein n=1 Tax=unclassified Actinoplanes TaxID=2626549 RepID=UPI00023ECAEA|nr:MULTISPECIES: hypothetical protein [unclassified Actinoplanes]AEV83730.1 hypothetical protein ACPL_2835 [Actinoplanes sp. SE50/110]ATO82126.1 hypothetical protein ACWT_2711 [Actinoplanes sp. SE50]SLL99533.1 uncharacterized protein ACSP50_2764 [Actinoplanes sp. SE50/110]